MTSFAAPSTLPAKGAAAGSSQSGAPRARVAVILVNCDGYAEQYLEDCYASLQAQTYPSDAFSIFLVNNGASLDPELVARMAPGVRVLENARNLGWGGGNNTAIKVGLREGIEHFVFLNMDTVVEPDWLGRLLDAAEAHPALHILQSTLLLHGTDRINSLGNRIQYLGFGYCNAYGEPDAPAALGDTVDFASGAAMLVRRVVFETVGLFREDYFMYYDDMEFCWRARLAGFNVGLAEASRCHHKYNFRVRLHLLFYLERNRWLTLLTLPRRRSLALLAPCLLVSQLVVALVFVAHGRGQIVWQVIRYFAASRTWATIHRRRMEVSAYRVRSDAEIVARFAATIKFAEIDHPILRYLMNPALRAYWAVARRLIVW